MPKATRPIGSTTSHDRRAAPARARYHRPRCAGTRTIAGAFARSSPDLALRKIEKRSARLTPTQADRAEELVRTATTATDGKLVARRIAATDPDEYAVALTKALSQKNPAFTPEEGRAVNVFREVHDAETRAASESGSFAFGLPWYVDPTIIFTTQDSAEIAVPPGS